MIFEGFEVPETDPRHPRPPSKIFTKIQETFSKIIYSHGLSFIAKFKRILACVSCNCSNLFFLENFILENLFIKIIFSLLSVRSIAINR